MKICPLCKTNPADKRNSHIIPKFLGKPLFEKVKPRHSLQVDRGGKTKKIQDIPKEDFLICQTCEKKFEILETYFSKKLVGLRDYSNRKTQFEISQVGPNKLLNCLDLNPFLFKLFYFSLIWRLSITSNPLFKNFKLPKDIESEIGTFLDRNLFVKHQELLDNFDLIRQYPDYHLIAYKPEVGNKTFAGILTAFRLSEDHYGIFTSDMILFFYLNDKQIDKLSEFISNKEKDIVKFVLANSDQWKKIGSAVVKHRLLNNSS
jgi:hypothetical protein